MDTRDENQPFVKVLNMMGVNSFDPLVPAALNEYAARFASELLKDARDYSSHAGRTEINSDDVKLAVKLNDAYAVSLDSRESVANSAKERLQAKGLTDLADPHSVRIRYPPGQFVNRAHTYIPGSEGYTEEMDEEDVDGEHSAEETKQGGINTQGGTGQSYPSTRTSQAYDPNVGVKFQPGSRAGPRKLDQAMGFAAEES